MHYFFKKKTDQVFFKNKIYISALLCPETPVCKRREDGGKRAPNFTALLLGVFCKTPKDMLLPAFLVKTPERVRWKGPFFCSDYRQEKRESEGEGG